MANYSADDVKRLREATAAGMLDCKKALDEADGDFDKAVEIIRVKGLKGVTKREGRLTSNGLVVAKVSQATRASGSSAKKASKTASEMRSQTLSGWPSDTGSEVNTYDDRVMK